jgi:hypothetical protein
MKTFINFILAGAAVSLGGCASPQAARDRDENFRIDMAYNGQLAKYACGYRQNASCHRSPALPHGYSKDSGSREGRPARPVRNAPVALGPVVRAYQMGRYVDTADPRIVHEGHTVYRLEGSPSWQLRAPRVRSSRPAEYQPELLPEERERELSAARVNAEQASAQAKDLSQKIDVLQDALKANAGAVNQNNQSVAAQIRDLKAQLDELKTGHVSAPASVSAHGPMGGIRLPGNE